MSEEAMFFYVYPALAAVLPLLVAGFSARHGYRRTAWTLIALLALLALAGVFATARDHGWGSVQKMFITGYFVIGTICGLIGLAIGAAMRERRQGPNPEA